MDGWTGSAMPGGEGLVGTAMMLAYVTLCKAGSLAARWRGLCRPSRAKCPPPCRSCIESISTRQFGEGRQMRTSRRRAKHNGRVSIWMCILALRAPRGRWDWDAARSAP